MAENMPTQSSPGAMCTVKLTGERLVADVALAFSAYDQRHSGESVGNSCGMISSFGRVSKMPLI